MIRFARTRYEAGKGRLFRCIEISQRGIIQQKTSLFSKDRFIQYTVANCKHKVVQAAIIIFLNYKIFSTIFKFC